MNEEEKILKLRKLTDAMYYAAQYLTTDASRLHKAMEEYHQFIINEYHKEEPVSKDLEVASMQYGEELDNILAVGVEDDNSVGEYAQEAFKAGAQWQKEQFEKNRLKHCDSITNEQAELEQGFIDQHLDKYQRMPTYLDAIEYGMNLQKEQMMAKAIDAEVHIDAGGYPYIPQMELYDYDKDVPFAKKGDKYKVILIKEE